jgi:transcriptional regulator with XRE-family HTH domain
MIQGSFHIAHKLHSYALNTSFTLHHSFHNNGRMKGGDFIMIFSERLKKEREKRNWSQNELAEKIHVSRQSVSKWETGKNYPSIEVIIHLSDLFSITIDELLRSDVELKEKVIRDSKHLAHPKMKVFFDSVFMLGALLLVSKLMILGLNKFGGTDINLLEGLPFVTNFLPLILMVIGGIGSDKLKEKYIEE